MSIKDKPTQPLPAGYKIISEGPIPVDRITVQSNCRKEFEESALKELAANIQKVGVIQPIVVRPDGNKFILVAGERRLRAAKLIELAEIPARVMELDDHQAEEIQALENLHRKDLNPIEEAQAFQSLQKSQPEASIEDLAAKVDKPPKYVYRALRLLDLPAKLSKEIMSGSLTAAHGHQILRAPKEKWDSLITFALTKGWRNEYPTIQELKHQVEKVAQRDLGSAYFPKDKPYAGVPACTECPYNTGNQDMLFDGASKGHCTNPGCYLKKSNQALKDLRDQTKTKFPKLQYVGTAAGWGYNQSKSIKNHPVVDPSNKKIKALLKDSPDKFGFGIIKPNAYSSEKKPQVFLVCIDPTLLPKEKTSETETRDWEKDRFTNTKVQHGLFKFAWEKLQSIQRRDLDDLLWILLNQDTYGDSLVKDVISLAMPDKKEIKFGDIKELPDPAVLRMIYFCILASDNDLEKWFSYHKIDHKPAAAKLKIEAEKEYETLKSTAGAES